MTGMFSPLAYVSLTTVIRPHAHQAENELQHLYHMPELQARPDVAWGERWVLDPECASLAQSPATELPHYLRMHWLRDPVHASARAFLEHFERAAQTGQTSARWTREGFGEFMVPLKGYVRREPLVSEQALPFRPNTGVFLIISRFIRHHGIEAEDIYRWYDQVRIPDMLACGGAAGAWTFAGRELFSPRRDLSQPALRMQLFFLDGDPAAFAREVAAREPEWARQQRARDTTPVEEMLFAGPLRRIVPWRWNWFDGQENAEVRS